jgi:chemotaxis methyl-accepting protein methylase
MSQSIAVTLTEEEWEIVTRALSIYATDIDRKAAHTAHAGFSTMAEGLIATVTSVRAVIESIDAQMEG